ERKFQEYSLSVTLTFVSRSVMVTGDRSGTGPDSSSGPASPDPCPFSARPRLSGGARSHTVRRTPRDHHPRTRPAGDTARAVPSAPRRPRAPPAAAGPGGDVP